MSHKHSLKVFKAKKKIHLFTSTCGQKAKQIRSSDLELKGKVGSVSSSQKIVTLLCCAYLAAAEPGFGIGEAGLVRRPVLEGEVGEGDYFQLGLWSRGGIQNMAKSVGVELKAALQAQCLQPGHQAVSYRIRAQSWPSSYI